MQRLSPRQAGNGHSGANHSRQTTYIVHHSHMTQDRQPRFAFFLDFLFAVSLIVEMGGIEPPTSCLQSRRSPSELHPPAKPQAALFRRVGVLGFEPRTSALSELRSSQLSYTPALRLPSGTAAQTEVGKQKSQTFVGLALSNSRHGIERQGTSRMSIMVRMNNSPTTNKGNVGKGIIGRGPSLSTENRLGVTISLASSPSRVWPVADRPSSLA